MPLVDSAASEVALESLKEPSNDSYNTAKLNMSEAMEVELSNFDDIQGRIGDNEPVKKNENLIDSTFSPSASPIDSPDILGTLDEPIRETIMRDVKLVVLKLKYVLLPRSTLKELRNWDLWGPLILCLMLASTLSITAKKDQTALVFTSVIVIVWFGAAVVTLNAALLGGKISFLQSLSVLGYCLCPLNIAAIVCRFWGNKLFQLIVVLLCLVWSTSASVGFMSQLVKPDRKALAVYPVLLFYITIGWMVIVQ